MNYLDFDLEILTATTEGYPMAVRSDAGDARATLRLPFDPRPDGRNLELQNRLLALRVALLSSGGKQRRALTNEEEQVQHFGRELFEALMVGDIRSRFDLLQERAQRQGAGVRLRLRIQPPEVATLPWEFLYDGRRGEYVCLSLNTPVVRYLETTQPSQPLLVTPPLRILGLVCSPRDLETLNVALEKQRVERAVADLVRRGLVELTWLEGQSWRDLQRAMRRGPWHIFHFVGHGDFDAQREEGFVALTDDEGLMYPLYANELSRLLADHRPLRLAFLNACAGARSSSRDLFSSTAAALVRRGVAAVLAMQYPITDAAAIEFAQTFYESLAEAMPVDAATSEARKAISISIANSHEWGTPVLMMRSPDGQLFEIGDAPVIKADTRPEQSRREVTRRVGEGEPLGEQPSVAPPATMPIALPTPAALLSPTLLATLRTVLATLYPDENSARRVTYDAGIDDGRIAFAGRAVDNWHAILREAEKVGKLTALLTVALQDYGDNQSLQAVVAALGLGELLARGQETRQQTRNLPDSRIVQSEAAPSTPLAPTSQANWQKIGIELVEIAAGEFLLGSDKAKDKEAFDDELPQHKLYLPAFRIARQPVTVAQFEQFVKATSYKTMAEVKGSAWNWAEQDGKWQWLEIKGAFWAQPRGPQSDVKQKANHPVTCVSWHDAQAFCAWAGVRLPSEAEWERAARGSSTSSETARIYPWGNDAPDQSRCNYNMHVQDTTPVGNYPKGATPEGLLDMAGNVLEWTISLWGKDANKPDFGYPYKAGDGRENLTAGDDVIRVVRGGSFAYNQRFVRCAFRDRLPPEYRSFNLGFRVVAPGS